MIENKWQLIETAPKDDKDILLALYTKEGKYYGQSVGWWSNVSKEWRPTNIFFYGCDIELEEEPKFWQPLPAPPENI